MPTFDIYGIVRGGNVMGFVLCHQRCDTESEKHQEDPEHDAVSNVQHGRVESSIRPEASREGVSACTLQ